MLQTALLEPFLVQKTEEQNREETVKECIDNIRPLSRDFSTLLNHKDKTFFQKLKAALTHRASFLMYIEFIFGSFLLFFPIIEARNVNMNYSGSYFFGSLFILMSSAIFYIMFKNISFDENSLTNSEINNKTNIFKLFSALSDKKFEIRGELLENYSKLKLIIEENQYIDGTTSVKESEKKFN